MYLIWKTWNKALDFSWKLFENFKVKLFLGWISKVVLFKKKAIKHKFLLQDRKFPFAFCNIHKGPVHTKFQKKIFIYYKVIQLLKLCNFGSD